MSRYLPTIFVVSLLIVAVVGIEIQLSQLSGIVAAIRQQVAELSSQPALTVSPSNSSPPTTNSETTEKKIQDLDTAVEELEQRVTTLEKRPTTTTTTVTSTKSTTAREIILDLGSGNTTNRDWTLLSSTFATFNTANYGKVKSVKFEAGLSIINGEAHARLVDKKNDLTYYSSELSNNTSSTQWSTSPAFSISTGAHDFQVELKSTSGERANLDGARIRITVE